MSSETQAVGAMVSTSYSNSKPGDTLRGGVSESHGVGVGLRGGLERASSDTERGSVRSVGAEVLRLGERADSGDEIAASSSGVVSREARLRDGAGLADGPGLREGAGLTDRPPLRDGAGLTDLHSAPSRQFPRQASRVGT